MTSVILAPKDPFDLRTQTFRVNVELSTYYHRHTRKKFFDSKGYFRTFFSKKKIPGSAAKMGIKRLHLDHWWSSTYPKFFSSRKVTFGHFSKTIFYAIIYDAFSSTAFRTDPIFPDVDSFSSNSHFITLILY